MGLIAPTGFLPVDGVNAVFSAFLLLFGRFSRLFPLDREGFTPGICPLSIAVSTDVIDAFDPSCGSLKSLETRFSRSLVFLSFSLTFACAARPLPPVFGRGSEAAFRGPRDACLTDVRVMLSSVKLASPSIVSNGLW